jgi:hypothetical protein
MKGIAGSDAASALGPASISDAESVAHDGNIRIEACGEGATAAQAGHGHAALVAAGAKPKGGKVWCQGFSAFLQGSSEVHDAIAAGFDDGGSGRVFNQLRIHVTVQVPPGVALTRFIKDDPRLEVWGKFCNTLASRNNIAPKAPPAPTSAGGSSGPASDAAAAPPP